MEIDERIALAKALIAQADKELAAALAARFRSMAAALPPITAHDHGVLDYPLIAEIADRQHEREAGQQQHRRLEVPADLCPEAIARSHRLLAPKTTHPNP